MSRPTLRRALAMIAATATAALLQSRAAVDYRDGAAAASPAGGEIDLVGTAPAG